MGNELRIDTYNNAVNREVLTTSYDKLHNIESEPSIWEHFSPMAMGGAVLFPLLFNSKEFKHVNLSSSLSGKDLYRNKYRMIRLNELEHNLDFLKLNKTVVNGKKVVDPFLNAELLNLKHEINLTKRAGELSKDALTQLNKKYFEIADKTVTWKKSPIQKALMKAAKVSPNMAGEFTKAFKNNKIMLLFETLLEVGEVYNAFTTPTLGQVGGGINVEAGTKQLVKSAGRVAVGYTGFAAGTAMGLKIGAMLGSVIPGAGTVMGGIIGSAIGFAVGGVVSQLAKSAYNSIIPDTKTESKIATVENILDNTDTSETAKNILEQEIATTEEYLKTAEAEVVQAQENGDSDSLKKATENKTAVEKGREVMLEIYQKKFGNAVLSQNNTPRSDNPQRTTTTQASPQYQTFPQTTGVPMGTNPMLVGNSSMTDWSSMLPLQLQQNLFATA